MGNQATPMQAFGSFARKRKYCTTIELLDRRKATGA
jgi:hypothetical protein